MSEQTYPKYRLSKDIEIRFAPRQTVISCTYNQLVRSFGRPNLSVDNNDSFDGTEQCAWHIQFESGDAVILAEHRPFGETERHYEASREWKINTRSTRAVEWVKQIIRDSNPNETGK